MILKKLSVATFSFGVLANALASSNCEAEPPLYVIQAVEQLGSATEAIVSQNRPKSWLERLQQSTLGSSSNSIEEKVYQLIAEFDSNDFTECDTKILVPQLIDFTHSLTGQVSTLNSYSFEWDEILHLESILSNLSYDCDDYRSLSDSISQLNSAISSTLGDSDLQSLSFPNLPSSSKFCQSDTISLSKLKKEL